MDIAWVTIRGVVGLLFGVLRGGTLRIFVRDGVLRQSCTKWTIVARVAYLAATRAPDSSPQQWERTTRRAR